MVALAEAAAGQGPCRKETLYALVRVLFKRPGKEERMGRERENERERAREWSCHSGLCSSLFSTVVISGAKDENKAQTSF